MKKTAVTTLRTGHFKALNTNEETAETPLPWQSNKTLAAYYERHERLRKIPEDIIRKGWFTMAHLLLQPGAHVVDVGCGDGTMTYVMAALNPQIHFFGVDMDKKAIGKAQEIYNLSNLEYRTGDIASTAGFEENSLDAVINSFILHEIFSSSKSKYDDRHVVRTLEIQFSLLKRDGLMFIRDFAKPPPDEYVLMEMPDAPGKGKDFTDLSEPDLLVWYSEHARPREDPGCHGFFLEELPPRFPKTRLFRVPHRWAYEFIIRKDNRKKWRAELPKEYTFFTPQDFRKTLRNHGARVLYSAPYWDQTKVKRNFEGRFRLYNDDGTPLGTPPTSFIAVAQKKADGESLRLHERRPSQKAESHLQISAMRNDKTGRIVDIVKRDMDQTEIIPYRITENGELNIFIHRAIPRGIANAVPRSGREIDGKRWSGHMTEAIAVPSESVIDAAHGDIKESVLFARDYLGLKPAMACALEKGPTYYPAPDYIDEAIKTYFLRVTESKGPIQPKIVSDDIKGFTTQGRIWEVNAQRILDSIAIGFIPNAHLEIQIQALYRQLGIDYESWAECPLSLKESIPEKTLDGPELIRLMSEKDDRYQKVRGTTGQLRSVQSIFVDDCFVGGAVAGMASRPIEFVIPDEHTINTAVVLPLTKHAVSGEIMAGMVTEYLPIPQRYSGNGMTVRAPSFPLPKNITSMDKMKAFIAEKFNTSIESVASLGESYFCHIGITPQRIFPFAVATRGEGAATPAGGTTMYAPLSYMMYLQDIMDKNGDWNMDKQFMGKCRETYKIMGYDSDLHLHNAAGKEMMNKANGPGVMPGVMNVSDIMGISPAKSPSEPPSEPIEKKKFDFG